MARCNELCTKGAKGTCALCEARAEADRFIRLWFKGGLLIDGVRALKQWRQSNHHGVIPLVPPGGYVYQQGLWERAERLRGAADEAARLAQNVYLSFLFLGTYIAVIIGSTTDVQLLKVSPVTLPLLNVQLPIVGFYVVVPWLLLLIYFNLLLHLTFLAQRLHWLNALLAAFPDDIVREEQRIRLFSFPFSAMLIGRPGRWRLRLLLGLMALTTVVLLPLILLLWAQVGFLPYHDTAITWNHRAAVLADLMLLWVFWPLMLPPVQRTASAAPSHRLWRVVQYIASARRFRWATGLSCLTLVTVVFSLGIAVLPEEDMEGRMVSIASHLSGGLVRTDPARADKGVFKLTHWLFEMPGAPFHRNLRLQEQVLVAGEPSAKVIAALQSEDEAKRTQALEGVTGITFTHPDLGEDEAKWTQALEEVTGLILTNRDLRGANFRGTLFPKGDLRGANLQGANLVGARVFAGHLSIFQISKGERCVDTAQQSKKAPFCQTNLQGADLRGAQLQGADLTGAWLQGANLRGAHIGSAGFTMADLTLSDLRSLSLLPLDERTYEALKQELTDAIRNERRRADLLKQIKAVVGQPAQLQLITPAKEALCDDVTILPIFCLAIVEYAHARAEFLRELGCEDAAVARGVAAWHVQPRMFIPEPRDIPPNYPVLIAFAKRVTAITEKGCPGWAGLPAKYKDKLRKLATREID